MELSAPAISFRPSICGYLSLHDVMVVSGQDGNTCPRLPIPDPDSLIIRGRDDPGVFSVEEDSSDIVEICHQYHPNSKRIDTHGQSR